MHRLKIQTLTIITLTLAMIAACSKSNHVVSYPSDSQERHVLFEDDMKAEDLNNFLYGSILIDSTDKGLIHKDWLYALEAIGSSDLLWENRENYGFINDDRLNASMAIGYGFAGDYLTFNCAGCHTGYMREGDELMIIPGGSNPIGPRGYVMIHVSLLETIKKSEKLERFYQRLKIDPDFDLNKKELRESISKWTEDYMHTYLESVIGIKFPRNNSFLTAYRMGLRFNNIRKQSFSVGSHPFTTASNLWARKGNYVSKRARVDFSPIFNYEHFTSFHYSGNATSRVERTIIASLNSFNNPSLENIRDLDLEKILEMESSAFALEAPPWPQEILGPIDYTKAQKGELLFNEHCVSCHPGIDDYPETDVHYSTDSIGTDEAYFDIWKNKLKIKDAEIKRVSYEEFLGQAMDTFMVEWQHDHGYSDSLMQHANPSSKWSFPKSWIARPLTGIWASPPYLHNGSVPTIYDLLLPETERPKRFSMGVIEYDQEKVGVLADAPTSTIEGSFRYNTSRYGSSNDGHEYGIDLSESERFELIEYIKTL